jgi:hypothetical protein
VLFRTRTRPLYAGAFRKALLSDNRGKEAIIRCLERRRSLI